MNINKALSSPVLIISFFWLLALIWSISWFEPHAVLRLACLGFAFVAAALSFGFSLLKDGLRGGQGLTGIFLLLFWVLAGSSILWSDIPFISIIFFAAFSLLPLTFFMISLNNDTGRLLRHITVGAFFFAAILAIFVIVQYFFLPDMLVGRGVRYPFANPNSFAGFFCLVLFGGLAWMVTTENKKQGNAAFLFCALCLAALILLAGRGAFLSFLLGVIVFLGLAGRETLQKHVRCLTGLLVTGVATMVAAPLFGAGQTTLWGRLQDIGPNGDVIILSRTKIWQSTWEMIEKLPLTGHGIGTFFLYYPEYRVPSESYSGGFMAHNDPLQFWMEMGILAPVLFYGMLAYAIYRSVTALRNMDKADKNYLLLLAATCGLGAFILHTHITFHFYVAPLLLLFGLALSWWQHLSAPALINKQAGKPVFCRWPEKYPVAAAWFTVLLPFAAFYIILQGFLFSEHFTNRARTAIIEGDMMAFAKATNEAHHFGFGWNARAYLLAAAIPLGILDDASYTMTNKEKNELITQTETLLDQAARHNPRLVGTLYYRALLEPFKNGEKSEQIALLEDALRLNPTHLPSREMLVMLYLNTGQEQKALGVIKEGLQWKTNTFDPVRFYEIAVNTLEKLEGKDHATTKQARDQLERAFAKKLKNAGLPFIGNGNAISLPAAVPDGSAIVP